MHACTHRQELQEFTETPPSSIVQLRDAERAEQAAAERAAERGAEQGVEQAAAAAGDEHLMRMRCEAGVVHGSGGTERASSLSIETALRSASQGGKLQLALDVSNGVSYFPTSDGASNPYPTYIQFDALGCAPTTGQIVRIGGVRNTITFMRKVCDTTSRGGTQYDIFAFNESAEYHKFLSLLMKAIDNHAGVCVCLEIYSAVYLQMRFDICR